MSADVGSVQETSSTSLLSSVRPIGGSIYGIISWAVGFVAVGAVFLDRVEDGALDFGQESTEFIVDFFAWVFYGAHTVDLEVTGGGATETWSLFEQFLIQDTVVFHVIPAGLLFVSGYIVAMRVPRTLGSVEGGIAGASVAVGYAVLTFVGVSYFTHTVGGLTYAPPMVDAMLYMGVGYPVLFGGLGGFLQGM
ncbi:hypothetical protein [Halobacterium bonnevillei]|uniref:DUF7978 domain-containing protein n=1 Tax=Halobacterium bonnevillei TaxID=2692200 RepID=A0A6B0SHK5_9EURY|nr:hypothetical protein [Halobacterium bonnevillei]MXR19361.1 hypothetical protein [Halobacterium bonnevillei]